MNRTILLRGTMLSVILIGCVAAAPEYKLLKTFSVTGEGRWDYITVDAESHRLYVPRSTHVQVIDSESGKLVADWPDTAGVHGVALVPEKHLAFTSNGRSDSVSVFDLRTNKKIADVKTGQGPDAISYDESSGKVLAFNHKGGTVTFISIGADQQFTPQELEVGGTLEFAVVDGHDHAFVNVEDKNEVVEIDTKAVKVLNRWPIKGGEAPTGLAIDTKNNHLFIGCSGNDKLVAMECDDGKILATLPIGHGCDGVAYDYGNGNILAACGEGTISVALETKDDEFAIVQTLKTKPGARTIAVDSVSHFAYLPTAELEPAADGKRPEMKPNTFQILVVGK